MMQHIPDEELALYTLGRASIPPERRDAIAAHLTTCSTCLATHDFLVAGDADLADEEAWESIVGSATFHALMQYGARIAEEDAQAERLLAPYLGNAASAAWEALTRRKAFRTGGVVRTLNAHAHSICEDDALGGLTFADAAVSVAEALPDDLYPAGAVNQLRATAWKERASALMLLGRFPAAHDALDHAERLFGRTMNNGLGLSLVALVRAGVYYEQQMYALALEHAERAEHGFAHISDEPRRMDAVYLRGSIFMEAGDPTRALELYRQVVEYAEHVKNARLLARGLYVSGHAEVDRSNLDAAMMFFNRALVMYRDIGPEPERVATEWGVARVFMKSGRLQDAIDRLRRVQGEFEKRALATDAALVGLDIAECLLAMGRTRPIVPLAKHIFRVFKDAGMLTGALAAIAYMREAATSNILTAADLDDLRRFLRRAERQPSLVFAPPPRSE